VYLWTGHRANIEEEKKQAMEAALDYTKLHPIRKQQEGNADDILCIYGLRYTNDKVYVGFYTNFVVGNQLSSRRCSRDGTTPNPSVSENPVLFV
jgi:hypothetical protein